MTAQEIKSLLTIGENAEIEFKRAGSGPQKDTYETICAFLNRNGGDLLLGVEDDGSVLGLPANAVEDMVRSIVRTMNDPNQWQPQMALRPEVVDYEGRKLIHVRVVAGPDVYWYRGKCYDRVHESDVVVTGTSQFADMCIRKRQIYTEQHVYPYVTKADLRMDLLPRVRNMALSAHGPMHPWVNADDDAILRSAKLLGRDFESGRTGFNAAAVLLLGTDYCIGNVFPAYKTDALLRRVNVDRYDDRVTVATNLVEAFDQLMAFGEKHLDEKFFMENGVSISLRAKILREMIGNTLVHREYTSAMPGQFVIQQDCMYTENANKAFIMGVITPDNLRPYPKNPILANFFHQVGRADELGSGVRNLYHYVKIYSGGDPVFDEKDIFRLSVPLKTNFSPEKGYPDDVDTMSGEMSGEMSGKMSGKEKLLERVDSALEDSSERVKANIVSMLDYLQTHPSARIADLAKHFQMAERTVSRYIRLIREKGLVKRIGADKSGHWEVC